MSRFSTEPPLYNLSNHSAYSSKSSIAVSKMSFDESSQASIVSSYAPSLSVLPKLLPVDQGGGKESAIKRYLRSKLSPRLSSKLSTVSLLESRRILKASGVSSADHINLYNVCFALSASLASDSNDLTMAPSSCNNDETGTCVFCGEDACISEECIRNWSSDISIVDRLMPCDAKGNTYLHRAVQHGRKTCVEKLLEGGADPNRENAEGMNAAVYGWGFLTQHRDNEQKYANIWVCMLRVLEKQREIAGAKGAIR
jgi:Ankyrin repeat